MSAKGNRTDLAGEADGVTDGQENGNSGSSEFLERELSPLLLRHDGQEDMNANVGEAILAAEFSWDFQVAGLGARKNDPGQ